ncbi:5'-nucleotidase C-terminal domain-containing protein [Filibacter tadaridae]|uniref:Trifunctional nucleotide phosphoesterase protein YfkN n=1 Tax=Filibacter tadaridae TaxID=2483811 RepID=A0A3P5WQV7_9BACL|nr:5'-nucleotidase C-terminal domain-containing protein [Filibacter tadaridae]VDC23915.1 Trifunctional nucleotide phosphoesterase protein YfkN precursor [Filibacter tadaridae]
MTRNRTSNSKIMTGAVTAALVATALTPAASAAFHDSTGHYKEAVSYVTSNGIAKGYTNGYFGTADSLERGDAAVMIAKALGLDVKNAPESSFKDLNNRVKGAVNALYNAGVIQGKSGTQFAPNDQITRVELAKVIAKAYGLKGGNLKNDFTDVNSNWDPFVDALLKNGITKGKSSKEFGANQDVTRGEFALFVYRAKDFVDTEAPTLSYSGETTINVTYGSVFKLPVVTVKDNKDTNVKVVKVIRDKGGAELSVIDTTKPGTYTITYSAKDAAGNKAKDLVFTVIVKAYIGTPTNDKGFNLSIMHFNDTHAHLDNAAKRVTAVKEVRAEKPDALLLDAGDVFSGTLYFNEFQGQADVEFMNLMKVDAMTFGNHEFDLGSSAEGHKALADFIKAAKFPFVSSNVDFSKDDKFNGLFNTKISSSPKNANIYTGIVKEVNGEKVGIFGLTTEDTKDIASPEDITFSNYIEEAKKMVAEFEKMGINKVVAITHIGFDDNPAVDNDQELAKAVKGIDVIVGGHSHTTLKEPVLAGDKNEPTIIVQTGQYADNLGTLDVTFNKKGVVTAHNGKLIKIADKVEDPEAAEILKKYSSEIEEIKTEPTGATAIHALENPRSGDDHTKPSVRKNETPLGNVITDGMLAKAKTYNSKVIMALQNGGGIRTAIDEGPITVGEVIQVLPFGNTLATMEVSGAELKEAFETSLRVYPNENGGFLHVSGAKVEFDSSKPTGERVVSIKYKNDDGTFTEIQDAEKYSIATNAFTAKGGDGYDVFKKAYAEGRVTDLGLSDWENFAEHLKSLGDVDPKIEKRIVDVAGNLPPQELPGKDFSGTKDNPKVYNGNSIVNVTDVASLANATVNGNLTFIGTAKEELNFANIKVTGDLILSDLDGTVFNFEGIEVEGETIF